MKKCQTLIDRYCNSSHFKINFIDNKIFSVDLKCQRTFNGKNSYGRWTIKESLNILDYVDVLHLISHHFYVSSDSTESLTYASG